MHDKQLPIIRSVLSLIAGMTLVLFQHPSLWAQSAVDCNKDAQVVNLAERDGIIRIRPDRIGRHTLQYTRILVDENNIPWLPKILEGSIHFADKLAPVIRYLTDQEPPDTEHNRQYQGTWTVSPSWYTKSGGSGGSWSPYQWRYMEQGEVQLDTGSDIGYYIFKVTPPKNKRVGSVILQLHCRNGFPGTVNTAGLNIRTGPSTTYPRISEIYRNSSVTIIGRNADTSWLKITGWGQARDGWVSARYIRIDFNRELIPLTDVLAPDKTENSAVVSAPDPVRVEQSQPERAETAQTVSQPTEPNLQTLPAVKHATMDIDAYCRAKGFQSSTQEGTDAYSWRCRAHDGSLVGLDLVDLCVRQHGVGSYAESADMNNAYAWHCVVPEYTSTPSHQTPADDLGTANKFVDLNWDGQVNRDDLVPFQEYYADCQSISSENFLYKDRCGVIDYNDDGVINIEDFALFREYIEQ